MIKTFKLRDNTLIRYEVIGKGPPILLLHTFRNRLEYFYKISEKLEQNHSLYLVDLPGFGDSTVNTKTIYDEEFFTNSIVDFIKYNKLKNLIIAGESIGGVLPITISIKVPKLVKKIFLFNPYDYDSYFGEGISRGNLFARFILFNISLPFLGNFFSRLENKFILKNIMRGGFFDINNLSNDYLNLLCSSINKAGYSYHFRNVLKYSSSWSEAKKNYNKVSVPIKLVYGDRDWANKIDKNTTKELLGLKSYHTLKNCGHFSFLEKPNDIAKILAK